jgi:general secretion pathway protein L
LSTLYIRLPSKSAADSAPNWIALGCPFALVSRGDAIEREGVATLSNLAETIAKARHIVLLVAASDVTLLRLQVPPLSASRLKLALPNLVEDQLMSAPAECVIVAGAATPGLRTVAVAQRGWLEIVVKAALTLGARNVSALPAQLCLPHRSGIVSAAITQWDAEIDLTLRLSEQDGIGLPLMIEQPESAINEVLQALGIVVPSAPITLYVPQAELRAYQDQVNAVPGLDQRITLVSDQWSRWIVGSNEAGLNLVSGLGTGVGPQANWRPWRWPLALAAVTLTINVAALNIDWWRMKREANSMRANMIQTYKTTYPKETVVLDPLAQMKQKISEAQTAAGQLAPDDFTALSAKFGQAWALATQAATSRKATAPAIAAIEYRERSLWVRLKTPGETPTEQLKAALAAQRLSWSEPEAGVWKIRSAK